MDYVDDYYTVNIYKKAYDEILYPMPSEDQWIKTNYDKVEPSMYRIPPSRPKKLRIR